MCVCGGGHYSTMAKSFKVNDFFMFMGRLISGAWVQVHTLLRRGEGMVGFGNKGAFYEYLILH